MKVSLKARNIAKLAAVLAFNLAVFSGVVQGVLDVRDLGALRSLVSEAAREGAGWPYAVLITVVGIFNGMVPTPVKERLVFWTKPRPGCRAFSYFIDRDSTINAKVLHEHFGPLPSTPEEQNGLWVEWLHEFEDDARVRPTYGLYLFARDWATIAAFAFGFGGPIGFWLADDAIQVLWYAGVLAIQYAVARWLAVVQGEQLVMSVLSSKASALGTRGVDTTGKGV